MQDKLPLWRRIVKAVIAALLTIVLLAAFYIAVIMGNPQEEESSAITGAGKWRSSSPSWLVPRTSTGDNIALSSG